MGGGADGVLQSAALDTATSIATFTLTTGGTVTLDLSPLAGAQAVATDATVDGDGTAGDPLSIASYAGGAIASLAVNYTSQAFDVTHLDGTTASVSFTDIPAFRGVGGDTFTGASTFAFGDSAIVDSILYVYTDTSPSDYTPTTISSKQSLPPRSDPRRYRPTRYRTDCDGRCGRAVAHPYRLGAGRVGDAGRRRNAYRPYG